MRCLRRSQASSTAVAHLRRTFVLYCYCTCDVTPLARLKVIAEESQRKAQSVRHDPVSSRRNLEVISQCGSLTRCSFLDEAENLGKLGNWGAGVWWENCPYCISRLGLLKPTTAERTTVIIKPPSPLSPSSSYRGLRGLSGRSTTL